MVSPFEALRAAYEDADRERAGRAADRRQAIDQMLGSALDPILAPIARDRRAQTRRRIVELIDGVIENQKPIAQQQSETRG